VPVSNVSVSNTDNDNPGVSVSPLSGLSTSESGSTATFTIVLDSRPIDDVSIDLSVDDVSEARLSVSSVTFTNGNWNVSQTVSVRGQNDFIADGAVSFVVLTSVASSAGDSNYNNMAVADVTSNSNTDGKPVIVLGL
jgi:hypothetical protein